MPETPVRYLVIDDNELFRSGLTEQLAVFTDIELIGEFSRSPIAVTQVRERPAQVVLLGGSMSGMTAAVVTRALREQSPATSVCLLTMAEPGQDICAALAAGVRGLLPKESAIDLVHRTLITLAHGNIAIAPSLAIRFLATCYGFCPAPTPNGGKFDALTQHEHELVYGIAQAWTNQQVATGCGIAASTVQQHLRRLLEKLHLSDRRQLVDFAGTLGLRARW